ncbi:hypothetical protein SAMN03097708_03287, partial [Thiohalomonas denitrificans]
AVRIRSRRIRAALDKGITIACALRLVLTFLGGSESIAKRATVHELPSSIKGKLTIEWQDRVVNLGLRLENPGTVLVACRSQVSVAGGWERETEITVVEEYAAR